MSESQPQQGSRAENGYQPGERVYVRYYGQWVSGHVVEDRPGGKIKCTVTTTNGAQTRKWFERDAVRAP